MAPVDKASVVLVTVFAFAFRHGRPGLREWLGIAPVGADALVPGFRR